MKYKYLFGPVPSRRLGISLGVDLVPFKTCTLDCVYCECGKTTDLTVERKEYVQVEKVLEELNEYLSDGPDLDYITFSGSGEPTLHNRIDLVIDYLKDDFPQYSVVVLTNGTLFTQAEVREQLKRADVVIPSLDVASELLFKEINRPHSSLKCKDMISGLVQFRSDYQGEMRLEIFIVPGLNDTELELSLLKKAIQEIKPDSIQVGSLDRPGTEPWVKAATKEELGKIASYFGSADVIGEFRSLKTISGFSRDQVQNIVLTLKRRPCTAEDLAHILQLRLAEVTKYLRLLLETGKIESEKQKRGHFYKLKR
jgi:wyosine [tRNA(Phe)-imidazoG37] synthetase (radical SAM superfamily)